VFNAVLLLTNSPTPSVHGGGVPEYTWLLAKLLNIITLVNTTIVNNPTPIFFKPKKYCICLDSTLLNHGLTRVLGINSFTLGCTIAFMAYALFEVSLKTLLWRDDELLVLRSNDGTVDFPGGRIDDTEKSLLRSDIIARELCEELGSDILCAVGDVVFTTYRVYVFDDQTHDVLVVFYEAVYLGGAITISSEHASFEWVRPSVLLADPGSFKSADEYEHFTAYFANLTT
jgi:NUDIX domain